MIKDYYFNIKRDKAAVYIQAVFRGYMVRKHFLAVRLRYERIINSLDGESSKVEWKSPYLGYPCIIDAKKTRRLLEIEDKTVKLKAELDTVRIDIKERREYLLKLYKK